MRTAIWGRSGGVPEECCAGYHQAEVLGEERSLRYQEGSSVAWGNLASGASKHRAVLGTPRDAVLGLSLWHAERLAFPVVLVPPQQQRHAVQQSRQLRRRHWSSSSLAFFCPCWGDDGFIFGKHQLSSIVLVYPCYKTTSGTRPCLMAGLHNPPAALVLTRDNDLPFVEHRHIARRELWQTSS